MRAMRFYAKIFALLFILTLLPLRSLKAQGIGESFINSISSPWVWSPALAALAVSISPLDGKITDYASKHHPIYGSVDRAKNYSDIVAFYIFPGLAIASGTLHYAYTPGVSPWQIGSFIPSTALTYFSNSLIKDQTGRVRPDGSNNQSFPSAHTAIASVLSHEVRFNLQPHTTPRNSLPLSIAGEALVFTVAWARMEARKHHLSDVLVGYSIGKLFATWMRGWLFNERQDAIVYANTNLHSDYQVGVKWSF